MEHSTFGLRFGFVRWWRHLVTGEAPGLAEIARHIGRTGPGISPWQSAASAPTDYRVHVPLSEFFGLTNERWLIHGEGDPPDVALWTVWRRHRGAALAPSIQAPKPTPTEVAYPPIIKEARAQRKVEPSRPASRRMVLRNKRRPDK